MGKCPIQVSDRAAIETVIDQILAGNPKEAADYRSGKTKLLGFFMGQAMKATKGKANPKIVAEVLEKRLGQKS